MQNWAVEQSSALASAFIQSPGHDSQSSLVFQLDGSSAPAAMVLKLLNYNPSPNSLWRFDADVKVPAGCHLSAHSSAGSIIDVGSSASPILLNEWVRLSGYFLSLDSDTLKLEASCNGVASSIAVDNLVLNLASTQPYLSTSPTRQENRVLNPAFATGNLNDFDVTLDHATVNVIARKGIYGSYGAVTVMDPSAGGFDQASITLEQRVSTIPGKVYDLSVDFKTTVAMIEAGCGMEATLSSISESPAYPVAVQKAFTAQANNPPASRWNRAEGRLAAQTYDAVIKVQVYCRPPGKPVTITLDNISLLEICDGDCEE